MRASLAIHNATIWTADPDNRWASAIETRDGRITVIHAGRVQPAHDSIDAGGRFVMPGLIDAHLHLLMGGARLHQLDLSGVTSREAFEAAIEQRHRELPPEQWLIAWGWSEENWVGGGGAERPDRTWLRAATGGRLVVCYRMDMHAALVNDAVLAMCDISRDPAGGEIVRDWNDEPTGLMLEAAAWNLVNPLVPKASVAERRGHLLEAQRHAHRLGITAIGSMEELDDLHEVYAPLRGQRTLRCRLTLLYRDWSMSEGQERRGGRGRALPHDDHLAVIGFKAFIDGTLGSRTARMLRDYDDAPGNRGILMERAEHGRLLTWGAAVAAIGLSPSMHAIGDEAVRIALNVLDHLDALGFDRRLGRIEHAQHISDRDVPRFADRIASMQPLHKADDCRSILKRLGPRRAAQAFRFRDLLHAGATLAFGSDWPVVSCDPMLGMRAAITGLTATGEVFGEAQNLTVEQTLWAYTIDAATALRMPPHDAGVLRRGAVADMVVLDRNPFTADWANRPPRVVMTIAGGRVVYDAIGSEGGRSANNDRSVDASR